MNKIKSEMKLDLGAKILILGMILFLSGIIFTYLFNYITGIKPGNYSMPIPIIFTTCFGLFLSIYGFYKSKTIFESKNMTKEDWILIYKKKKWMIYGTAIIILVLILIFLIEYVIIQLNC